MWPSRCRACCHLLPRHHRHRHDHRDLFLRAGSLPFRLHLLRYRLRHRYHLQSLRHLRWCTTGPHLLRPQTTMTMTTMTMTTIISHRADGDADDGVAGFGEGELLTGQGW